jgi:hypothetical protein
MAKYAEAECATCHSIRPKNEMRQVKVERVIGRSYGGTSSVSSGSRQYYSTKNSGKSSYGSGNSFGSRNSSGSRTRTNVERLWVCIGCRAPRSDGWIGRLVSRITAIIVLGFIAFVYFSPSKRSTSIEAHVNQVAPKKDIDSETDSSEVGNLPRMNSAVDVHSQNPPPIIAEPAGVTEIKSPPEIVFAPEKEIVQPTSNAVDGDYPPCSSTLTDHCKSE